MLRRIVPLVLSVLVCLILGLTTAAATDNNPRGDKGSKKRADFCGDVYSGCIKLYCQDLPLVSQGEACVQQCEATRSSCLDAERTIGDLPPNISASVLAAEGAGLELTEVDVGGPGKGRLETICKSVKGAIFAVGAAGNFGCVKLDCDGKGGFCSIVCAHGICTGFLPDRPDGKLTLLGVLQNGDTVNHTQDAVEGPTKNGSGDTPPAAASSSVDVIY